MSEDRQAIIDEYGEVDRLAKLWQPQVNPHLKRKAELQSIIEGWYVDHPADQTALEQGREYQLEVSERHNQRELTEAARQKAFYKFQRLRTATTAGKISRFPVFSVFSVTLADIKKHLGEACLDQIAPSARTGPRTYKVVAKAAASSVAVKAA